MKTIQSARRILRITSLCLLLLPVAARAVNVDFLWIIDNSPSMEDEQQVLSAAADGINEQLAHAICPIDWRMAVAYTDLHLAPTSDDVCPGAPGPGRRTVCPFTSDMHVFRDGTPQCAYVRAGTCGDGSERGFFGAQAAISRLLDGSGCKAVPGAECSIRPDARLAVIFMTDTGEQTPSRNPPPGQPDNSVASWARYFSDFDLLTPGAQRAQVHGILCPGRPTPDDPSPCSDTLADATLFDRYSNLIDILGGTEGSIRNDDQSQLSETITSIIDATIAGACCGDGAIEAGEECDDGNLNDGDCCSSTCRIEPATTLCRPAAGPCDVAEFCTGSSASCPTNAFKPSTAECRSAAGPCDQAENCTGSSASCPANLMKPATTVCRAADGVCDVAETCTGTSPNCPANAYKPSTAECRPAAGACDEAENCTGTSASCPADTVKSAGTVCRAAAGLCDVAEMCDGQSSACPANAALPNGTPCDDGNACTAGETCSGFSCTPRTTIACEPSDNCHAAGTCDPATGLCSNPVLADGTPCSDTDVCTQTDTCIAGRCVGADPLPCADDGDPCTEDFCERFWGCMHKPLEGMAQLTCLCANGLDTPACEGQRIPDGASWGLKNACMLIARAGTAKNSRQAHRLITKAARKLKKAATVATKAGRTGRLTAACSAKLGGTIGTVRTQMQEIF